MTHDEGRVLEVQRVHIFVALPDDTVVTATVRGEFHETKEYPKVGDYVRVRRLAESEEAQAVIEAVLPRTSVIKRYDETSGETQVLVANVDLLVLVMGLDADFNISRLERYVALARQHSIEAVIVLNKADVSDDVTTQYQAAQAVAGASPVLLTTARTGDGLAALRDYITADTTAVLLGSSGAGKSTITNWLLGEVTQATQEVRENDSRGRHTTTTRQLFALPGGGYLIDTPGMRELALAEPTSDTRVLEQVDRLAASCRFSNCDHEKSAGCAVLAAVETGELDERALENYHKLKREQRWQQEKRQGGKGQYTSHVNKRDAQAQAARARKRLSRR